MRVNATFTHTGTSAAPPTSRAAHGVMSISALITQDCQPNLNVITMTARGSGLNPVRQMGLQVALRRMKQMCLRRLA
jgi:hypothetical protein